MTNGNDATSHALDNNLMFLDSQTPSDDLRHLSEEKDEDDPVEDSLLHGDVKTKLMALAYIDATMCWEHASEKDIEHAKHLRESVVDEVRKLIELICHADMMAVSIDLAQFDAARAEMQSDSPGNLTLETLNFSVTDPFDNGAVWVALKFPSNGGRYLPDDTTA